MLIYDGLVCAKRCLIAAYLDVTNAVWTNPPARIAAKEQETERDKALIIVLT